jgi:hypothetical protein
MIILCIFTGRILYKERAKRRIMANLLEELRLETGQPGAYKTAYDDTILNENSLSDPYKSVLNIDDPRAEEFLKNFAEGLGGGGIVKFGKNIVNMSKLSNQGIKGLKNILPKWLDDTMIRKLNSKNYQKKLNDAAIALKFVEKYKADKVLKPILDRNKKAIKNLKDIQKTLNKDIKIPKVPPQGIKQAQIPKVPLQGIKKGGDIVDHITGSLGAAVLGTLVGNKDLRRQITGPLAESMMPDPVIDIDAINDELEQIKYGKQYEQMMNETLIDSLIRTQDSAPYIEGINNFDEELYREEYNKLYK